MVHTKYDQSSLHDPLKPRKPLLNFINLAELLWDWAIFWDYRRIAKLIVVSAESELNHTVQR